MPRRAPTCNRVYHDADGGAQLCGGPTAFDLAAGAWTCAWCGRVMPGLYPALRRPDRPAAAGHE